MQQIAIATVQHNYVRESESEFYMEFLGHSTCIRFLEFITERFDPLCLFGLAKNCYMVHVFHRCHDELVINDPVKKTTIVK